MDVVGHTYYPFVDPKRYSKVSEPDNGSIGELLTIDDLLDFSNEDIGGTIGDFCHTTGSSTISLHESQQSSPNSSSPLEKSISHPGSVILGADGPADLCVPCDDLAELEWLSNFVEESFSSGDVATNVFVQGTGTHDIEQQNKHRVTSKQRLQTAAASSVSIPESSACSEKPYGSNFNVEVAGKPARARSKRCRTAVCFWNTCILSADAASILESCSTSTITVAKPLSHDDSASLAHEQAMEMESMRGKKKNLCKASNQYSSKSKKLLQVESATAQARKCLHCATQKTPQWRAGPMGPKTLCNACGVRYKSGRLLPEYRPAASPTFVETLHSNSHRRVLEMRNNMRDSEALLGAHEGAQQHCNLLQMQLGDGNDLVNELRDDIALVT